MANTIAIGNNAGVTVGQNQVAIGQYAMGTMGNNAGNHSMTGMIYVGNNHPPNITVVHKPEDENFNEFEKLILQYPNKWKSYDWKDLTRHQYISQKFIFAHLELPWVWEYITQNTSSDIIFNNLDLPWDWNNVLPRNVNDLLLYKDIPWNWRLISHGAKLNWDFIIDHPELPWLWDLFHHNHNLIITLKFLKENMDKNWDTNSLIAPWFDFKERDYRHLIQLKNLYILANEMLPKYLAMEIFSEECQMLSLYELSSIL